MAVLHHLADLKFRQLSKCLVDHLLHDESLLVPHGVQSLSFVEVLDYRETTFDRVELRRVHNVEDHWNLEFSVAVQ